MALGLYRTLVVWLLIVIVWGVYRGLAATDDSSLVSVIRDAAGIGVFAVPVGFVLWVVADSIDVKPK
jgi:Na+(H+)/acetate symporter ActP